MDSYTPHGSQVCQSGIVKTLFTENKFTIHDDWVEIYQNSDDANSENVTVKYIKYSANEYLMISDDGCGMTMEQIDNSLNLLKRGSKGGEKHGKFNFGGKAAILHLSGISEYIDTENKEYGGTCIVQSKSLNSKPVCYEMVGKELMEKGWEGTVKPAYLDSGREPVLCSKLWEEYPIADNGTHIYIQLTKNIKELLMQKHEDKWTDLQLACNERLNHCKLTMETPTNLKCEIIYKPIIDRENIIPGKFFSIPIKVYEKGGVYLFSAVFKELVRDKSNNIEYTTNTKIIKPHGNTKWKKELETIEGDFLDDYTFIGEFTMEMGCIFTYKIDEYFDDNNSNNDIHIIRNGFCLNQYNNKYCDRKARSGDFHFRPAWKNIKSTISYKTNVNGDQLDKIIGVNMHKADIKWDKLPTNLRRTIGGILDINGKKIMKYIQRVEYNPPNSLKKIAEFSVEDKYKKWLEHVPKYKVKLHKKNVCDKWKSYKTKRDSSSEEEYFTDSDTDEDPDQLSPKPDPTDSEEEPDPDSDEEPQPDPHQPNPPQPDPPQPDPDQNETRSKLKSLFDDYLKDHTNREHTDKKLINILEEYSSAEEEK